MYLAGNYCYQISAIAPPQGGADTLLTQVTRDNPSQPQ